MTDTMLPEERIYHCLQQLGVRRAHFAGRGARESGPLLQAHPQLVASLSLVSGTRAAEVPVEYARRVCCVRGDFGEGVSELRESGLVELGIREIVMRSCEDAGWTDTAAERPQEVLEALLAFWRDVEQTESIESVHLAEAEGALEGITFRTLGRGTPVVLLPLYLTPSQWEPLVGNLSAQHTVVLLGGPELVPLSSLEWRARSGYLNVVRSVIQETKLRPGERVLEVA